MPNLKISQLTELTSPTGATDVLPIVDTSGTLITKKITVNNLTQGSVVKNAPITPGTNTKITYDAKGLVTTGTAANLDDLGDVVTTTPSADQILKFNGTEWVNGSAATVSGSSGVEFYLDDTVILPISANNDYEVVTLSKFPVATAEVVDSIVIPTTTVLGEAYLYNTALGTTQIPAGAWEFDFYMAVNNAAGVTNAIFRVARVRDSAQTVTITGTGTSRTATASGGTNFSVSNIDVGGTLVTDSYLRTPTGIFRITARTSDTEVTITTPTTYTNESGEAFSVHKMLFNTPSPEINNTATSPLFAGLQLYSVISVQQAFTILESDKLAFAMIGQSDAARTLYFSHNGTTRYSHFHAPIATGHNDLTGLQGGSGSERYHLTSAQHTKVTTSNTLNNVLLGNTTSAPLEVAPGTAGNILTSDGTTWSSEPAPVSVSVTTKGDLQTHDGTNPERLGVGTDGQVLFADSGEDTGLIWGDIPSTSTLVSNEVPGGTIDGSNTAFTLAGDLVSGSLKVFLNGIRLKGGGVDYTEGTNAFTMVTAPLAGDILLVDYYSSTVIFAQGGTSFVDNETPVGDVDGVNTDFLTINSYVGGTLHVYRDGQRLTLTDDYTETTPASGEFSFVTAPVVGSVIKVDYRHELASVGEADTVDGFNANATPTANTILPLDANTKVPQDALYLENSLYRQGLMNSNFDVWQRGTSISMPASANSYGYAADRWLCQAYAGSGGSGTFTLTASQSTHTLGQTTIPNNPKYWLRYNLSALATKSGGNAFFRIGQGIEGVHNFNGQDITLSFWAKADTSRTGVVWAVQGFGTGGSPSATVTTIGNTFNLTTSWQQFSQTLSLPSITGKTLGTNGNDYLAIFFYLYEETNSVGTYATGVFDFSQIQLNQGSILLPYQPKTYAEELVACQRFYTRFTNANGGVAAPWGNGYHLSTTSSAILVNFPTPMRLPLNAVEHAGVSTIAVTQAGVGRVYGTAVQIIDATPTTAEVDVTVASGLTAGQGTFGTFANGATNYIAFNSDLI